MQSDKAQTLLNIISASKNFAFDVETNGIDWKSCHVCGYSASDGKESVYVPVRHALDHAPETNIDNVELYEQHLGKAIKEHKGKIIGHNIKFDAHMCENHNIKLGNKVKDTMVREGLINENRYSYSLEAVAKNYNIPQKKGSELYIHIANMVNCKPNRTSMAHYHRLRGDDPLAIEYAEFDTLATYHLFEEQEKEIYRQELEVVEGMESELTYVLQIMERNGICVDLEEYQRVKIIIEEMRLNAYVHIPLKEDLEPINVRSNKDLREYFEMCEIDNWEYTQPTERYPNGQPSFNKNWLGDTDEGILILNARKYDHLVDSFLTPFETFIHNGKIHTNFNQTRGEFGGARPGRLSSTNPNMQQVPKRDKQLGKIFRKVFTPRKDFIFVEYDHSQAEPRLYSHYSQEPILLDGYSKVPYVDMHSIAANMMGISREDAKRLNLGILYTMGAYKLSKQLRIPINEAKEIIRRWYQTFQKVGEFTYRASNVAKFRGYVRTILGRRARFSDPRWSYRAANRIIQGSSADILKWKMVQLSLWIERNNYQEVIRLILNIHDAILVEVHKDYAHLIPTIGDMFASVQEPPFNLRVPFYADYHKGSNWSEASYG
jgi:DNA polymerase-1